MATETKLQRVMYLLWHMTDDDAETLRRDLQRQMTRSYQRAITELAREFGCPTGRGNAPRGSDLDYMRDVSKRDADSIAKTYNANLRTAIQRIYRENPRANRVTWARRLQEWFDARNAWKSKQIAVSTEANIRHHARMRFLEENGIRTSFRLTPIVAVCRDCSKLIARGVVSKATVEQFPMPRHINCQHQWSPVSATPSRIECRKMWLG